MEGKLSILHLIIDIGRKILTAKVFFENKLLYIFNKHFEVQKYSLLIKFFNKFMFFFRAGRDLKIN